MQYFIFGVALLIALLFLGRWFVDAEPHKVAVAVKWGGLGLLLTFAALLLFSGRIGLILLLVPLIIWLRRFLARVKAVQGPSAGQSSQVRTRFLEMILDHDSGSLDGRILDGAHAGARLSQLELPELLELLREYRVVDPESAAVLEAYLDRTQAEDWRAAAGEPGQDEAASGPEGPRGGARSAGNGAMSREEALEILGLEEGAGETEIREAHRRLMQKLHPDHGGSNYLAAKLNQAKDLLLGH